MAVIRLVPIPVPMSLPDNLVPNAGNHLNLRFAAYLVMAVAAGQAGAGTPAPQIESLPAPRGEIAARYQAVVEPEGIRHDVTYASHITGALPPDTAFRAPKPVRSPRSGPLFDSPLTMIAVFGFLVAAIALWLRFGGTGALLARPPRELRQKPAAPDGWHMQDDANRPIGVLLAEIAAMSDHRAALVRLLRHCLLHAAATTGTRFARSDTERQALGRLPGQWAGRGDLADLLQETELAHYGGRSVAYAAFAQSLATARRVLARGPALHA